MKKKENTINDLVNYKNLRIYQNKNYFNFSLDSILLPNFIDKNQNYKTILDLCTGNAPIPLVLSTFTNADIVAVELQKEIYNLAKKTIKINKLDGKIKLLNMDARKITEIYDTDYFDLITCNPPYFKYNEESIINYNIIKAKARHEIDINLDDIFKISKKLLKNGGSVVIIHRTERLFEIIEKMQKNNIEPKRLRFIYPKINKESNLILIEGKKNGNKGIKVMPPLYVHDEDGKYTKEVLKMFEG